MTKHVFHFVSCVILIALLPSCCNENSKKPFTYKTTFVNLDNRKLQTWIGGNGENTVVFESGLGVDGTTWTTSGIFDSIGKENQIIAYNRSGYQPSTLNGKKRGIQQLVDDLDQIIRQKSTHQKVILVAHSLGGAIARMYAIQHPDRVKALLLIEPNHEKFEPFATMSQENEDELVRQFSTFTKEGGKSASLEAEQLLENCKIMQKLPQLPDIPVVVISSTKTDSEMTPENLKNWLQAHESLGKGLSDFRHLTTNKSAHFVYLDEPALIIKTIRELYK